MRGVLVRLREGTQVPPTPKIWFKQNTITEQNGKMQPGPSVLYPVPAPHSCESPDYNDIHISFLLPTVP